MNNINKTLCKLWTLWVHGNTVTQNPNPTKDFAANIKSDWQRTNPGTECSHDWVIWPETDGQKQRCMKCGHFRATPANLPSASPRKMADTLACKLLRIEVDSGQLHHTRAEYTEDILATLTGAISAERERSVRIAERSAQEAQKLAISCAARGDGAAAGQYQSMVNTAERIATEICDSRR